jgi:NAD(P)-dependent dehydrogenase (short-subunit alcohol dehydrogenase family)
MTLLFSDPYRALVIGSSGAIGSAFVRALQSDTDCLAVTEVARSRLLPFDLADEVSIAGQASRCAPLGPFGIIVDATGGLTIDGCPPEKSLSQLCSRQLIQSFTVNALGPALVMKHFAPLVAPGPSIFAKLSARVGSITDNRLGGWYGYRASKAALNMLLQTAAIELQRRHRNLRVVALQPGTVDSALSKPYQGAAPQVLTADESVAGMLKALQSLPTLPGAQFIDYRGNPIPW